LTPWRAGHHRLDWHQLSAIVFGLFGGRRQVLLFWFGFAAKRAQGILRSGGQRSPLSGSEIHQRHRGVAQFSRHRWAESFDFGRVQRGPNVRIGVIPQLEAVHIDLVQPVSGDRPRPAVRSSSGIRSLLKSVIGWRPDLVELGLGPWSKNLERSGPAAEKTADCRAGRRSKLTFALRSRGGEPLPDCLLWIGHADRCLLQSGLDVFGRPFDGRAARHTFGRPESGTGRKRHAESFAFHATGKGPQRLDRPRGDEDF
jgi:hypothetical protein